MNVILKISVRNLLRQKRRNLLLGIGIAFGMCLLVLANAFSHGISDILLNKMIVHMTGHIMVKMSARDARDEREWPIIRDKERIKQIILDNVEGIDHIEENMQARARVLGNSTAESSTLVGVEPDEEFYQLITVTEGNLRDLENPDIDLPIAVYETMAEDLMVQVTDTIRARFQTVYGQMQTARFTVVAIMKSNNPIMDLASAVRLDDLKSLMGYKDHETWYFSVVLKNLKRPDLVIEQANRLHHALRPNVAGYTGIVSAHGRQQATRVFAVAPDEESREAFVSHLQIVNGTLDESLTDEQTVLISQALADTLRVGIGEMLTFSYETRFEGTSPERQYRVGAIFQTNDVVADDMVFLHANQFYKTLFPVLPKSPAALTQDDVLFPMLLKEWILLERSPTRDALRKKYQELKDREWRGTVLDVQTMYENAHEALQLEQALKIITFIGVLLLFFIILIGVVNTLRMTIRERTREIGTVRAIGMQRGDVRSIFVTEVLLLTLFASIIGVMLACMLMGLLGLITFQADSLLTIFLVNKHLHFVPKIGDIGINLVIILVIALITAYFPALKAAKMSVANALRHYE